MAASISDLGIIIHQVRFGEADKFVFIFTTHHGLIKVVAKGARRLTSKKSPHLDNLNLIKFQTNRGDIPQYLSQVETVDAFSRIKSDLKKTRTCFYLTEILHRTLAEGETDEALFFVLKKFLEDLNLSAKSETRNLAIEFQRYLIGRLGFPPPKSDAPAALVSYFESLIDRPLMSARIKIG